MERTSAGFGVVLILIGIAGYVLSGGGSVTALIPAFFGLPILALAAVSGKGYLQGFSKYAVLALAALGFLGSVGGTLKVFAFLAGEQVERPLAVLFQSFMAMVCLIYIILWVLAFMEERQQGSGSA